MAEDEEARLSYHQLVRLAREEAGLTQQEAADLVGVHKNQWGNWESERGRPDLWTKQIEEAFGLDEGWFALRRDPLGFVSLMREDVVYIRERLDELYDLVRRLT